MINLLCSYEFFQLLGEIITFNQKLFELCAIYLYIFRWKYFKGALFLVQSISTMYLVESQLFNGVWLVGRKIICIANKSKGEWT